MAIVDNVKEFAGLPVKDFDPDAGIDNPEAFVYRVRLSEDDYDESKTVIDLLDTFLNDSNAQQVNALIIGRWAYDSMADSKPVVESLSAGKDKLPNLRALFIGDVNFEECEISWLQQTDISPLFAAFPQLEIFRVRGGSNLSLGELHSNALKTLIVETGGMDKKIVQQVVAANLPNLEHLELWLGIDDYGATVSIEDIQPLLEENRFPRLRYLGLCDSEMQDDLAIVVAQSPILNKLETLDLSLGTLTDKGAEALLNSPQVKSLMKLDIHHHYVSDEMVSRLNELGIEVDASRKQEADDYDGEVHRYVAVGE